MLTPQDWYHKSESFEGFGVIFNSALFCSQVFVWIDGWMGGWMDSIVKGM